MLVTIDVFHLFWYNFENTHGRGNCLQNLPFLHKLPRINLCTLMLTFKNHAFRFWTMKECTYVPFIQNLIFIHLNVYIVLCKFFNIFKVLIFKIFIYKYSIIQREHVCLTSKTNFFISKRGPSKMTSKCI